MTHRISRRHLVQGTAGLAAAAAIPAGIRPVAARQDGPIAIEFWHRNSGDAIAAWEELAAQFNEEYAGQFEVTAIAQGEIADLNQKVRAAAAGGGLPGALMADDYDVTQYAFNDIIVPIEPFLNDPEVGLSAEQQDDFLPSQLNRHELEIYDGHMMAFPQGFSAFTCFWNVDALQAAGFDGPPATWQDFPDHVRAVAEANDGLPGWYIGGAGDRFISSLLTHGVSWLKPSREESNFDAPEALEIMTWWKELSDEGLLAVPADSAKDAFVAGKCAYYMDSSGNTASFQELVTDFAWDCGLPPQGVNNPTPVTETYGPVNTLPDTDEDSKLAGWTWLKWLTSPAALSQWVMITNYFPSVQSVAVSPELEEYYANNERAGKLYREVAPKAQILDPHPALTQVRGQITANVVNEVLLDRLSPEEGVRKLKAESDAAIEQSV